MASKAIVRLSLVAAPWPLAERPSRALEDTSWRTQSPIIYTGCPRNGHSSHARVPARFQRPTHSLASRLHAHAGDEAGAVATAGPVQ